jgi:hypothetical protein
MKLPTSHLRISTIQYKHIPKFAHHYNNSLVHDPSQIIISLWQQFSICPSPNWHPPITDQYNTLPNLNLTIITIQYIPLSKLSLTIPRVQYMTLTNMSPHYNNSSVHAPPKLISHHKYSSVLDKSLALAPPQTVTSLLKQFSTYTAKLLTSP